jgi:hypothetical protein
MIYIHSKPFILTLFGGPPRPAEEPLEQRHMDLAASVQAVTEEIVLRMCGSLARETGQRNLCLAGGVALNCVANGKIFCFKTNQRIDAEEQCLKSKMAEKYDLNITMTVCQIEKLRKYIRYWFLMRIIMIMIQ